MKLKLELFLLCFLAFCGCEDKIDEPRNFDYVVGLNKNLEIEFDLVNVDLVSDLLSAGYSWCWENQDEVDNVKLLAVEYVPLEKGIGKPAKEVWTFIADKKGEVTLKFVYKRVFEPESDMIRKDIVVKVE